jgi:periodic tryptophan protein 1
MVFFLFTGNLLAVGTMEPFINIWDLDVIDTIDPVLTLGERKKKKSKKVKLG